MAKRTITSPGDAPKRLIRQQFSRNLQRAMEAKDWIAAQLSRQTGIAPDSVSYYLSGRNMPGPANAKKLANALGVHVSDLIPSNALTSNEREDMPDMEFKVMPDGSAWISIQKVVRLQTITKIIELIEDEKSDAKH